MDVIRRLLLPGTLPARVGLSACFASADAQQRTKAPVSTPPWTPIGEKTRPVALLCNFEPRTIPKNADPKLYKQYFRCSEVYLIGITHRDVECSADVQTAIRKFRPDGVFLELPDTKDARNEVIRTRFGPQFGNREEFRVAHKEAEALKIPKSRIVFGDVPWETTRKRARYTGHKDDWKQFLIANYDGKFPWETPKIYKAMITDRDLYMAHGLMKMLDNVAASKYSNAQRTGRATCLIAVVGSAHVPGIRRNWGRNISDDEIKRLLMAPEEERKYLLKKAVLPTVVLLILLVAYGYFDSDVGQLPVVAPAFAKALRPAVAEPHSTS